jgi:hypothetical protein
MHLFGGFVNISCKKWAQYLRFPDADSIEKADRLCRPALAIHLAGSHREGAFLIILLFRSSDP